MKGALFLRSARSFFAGHAAQARRARRDRPQHAAHDGCLRDRRLGLIGTPGTAGFISKWYLAVGALERGWWPLVFLIVASSLIAVVYVGRVVEVAYFRRAIRGRQTAKDPPASMLLPMLLLGAATVYFGIDTTDGRHCRQGGRGLLVGGLSDAAPDAGASSSPRSSAPSRARADPAVPPRPNLRESVTLATARPCFSSCSACCRRCSPAAGRRPG